MKKEFDQLSEPTTEIQLYAIVFLEYEAQIFLNQTQTFVRLTFYMIEKKKRKNA